MDNECPVAQERSATPVSLPRLVCSLNFWLSSLFGWSNFLQNNQIWQPRSRCFIVLQLLQVYEYFVCF